MVHVHKYGSENYVMHVDEEITWYQLSFYFINDFNSMNVIVIWNEGHMSYEHSDLLRLFRIIYNYKGAYGILDIIHHTYVSYICWYLKLIKGSHLFHTYM